MLKNIKIKESKKGKKVNLGRSSYGMNNVIMTYVDTEVHICEKAKDKNHNIKECLDCYDLDFWNCSGCAGDDLNSFYAPTYNLKCDCCGAGWNN